MEKRVLITGANKGIGRATVSAVLAADRGTFVYLGSRDSDRGNAARETILRDHPELADRLSVVALDVSDDASVQAARAAIGDVPLYGIVNNAGIGLGGEPMRRVLEVNTRGPRRVVEAFLPQLTAGGRIVNVSSASGPLFVSRCSVERRALLTDPDVTWEAIETLLQECLAIAEAGGSFAAAGLGDGGAYGLSKACLNAYTIALARQHPSLIINACTPGFIQTDLTRSYVASSGRSA
ncbi:MAG: SDR family NAD(P)-dependent oxidoreductase, partial [Myxococcales bacterium]|nr:SDR family NAD(P)-dependent oxidoreductase [Myxococcales bacterium]